ncbi:MAG: hypothetical protein ACLR67_04700, partial [Eggerthella lenta]
MNDLPSMQKKASWEFLEPFPKRCPEIVHTMRSVPERFPECACFMQNRCERGAPQRPALSEPT